MLLSLAVLTTSCVRRVTIPDSELALIFRDAFLVNAYVLNEKIEFDTLQVYQPIFDRYGYSAEDVAYTVGSFSKRKSARLGDVVEQAIRLLEKEEKIYSHEAMILDSVDAKAIRFSSRSIYSDDLVEFHSLSDTTKLRIELDSLPPGKYHISYNYHVDSLDNNKSSYRTQSWVEIPGLATKKGLSTVYLRKRTEAKHERTLNFDTLTGRVVILLAESFEAKRKPHVTFKDINVVFTPPTEDAVDQLFKSKLDIKIFAYDFFNPLPTDSLELSAL